MITASLDCGGRPVQAWLDCQWLVRLTKSLYSLVMRPTCSPRVGSDSNRLSLAIEDDKISHSRWALWMYSPHTLSESVCALGHDREPCVLDHPHGRKACAGISAASTRVVPGGPLNMPTSCLT
jgi:hypothetical protein